MKNSIYTFGFLTIIFFISSCGSTSNSNSSTKTNPHAEAHIQMHKEFEQEQRQKEVEVQKKDEMEPSKIQLQQFLLKKYQKGIDFYAVGNEPFWDLNIDFEKGFQFNNLDGLKFSASMVKPDKAIDAKVIRYRSVTKSGEIIVQLNQTACTDNMSGQKFDYTVTVDFKTSEETDYKTYKGCGNYVPDFRLNDIWAIVEVDGIKVNPENFKSESPRLEFNITEERVMGHDGCNSFNGSFSSEYKRIFIGNLASTMMACFANEEISTKIGKILSSAHLDYSFQNNLLILSKNHKKVMVLKHID